MEVNQKKVDFKEEFAYQKAKKKAREIRDFYINRTLFCFLMPIIIAINLYFVPEYHWFWFSLFGWGTGLTIHGLSVFEFHPFMKNNWEERKLQQFMQEDLEREKKQNRT